MEQASAVEPESCSKCDYRPRWSDQYYVEDHDVMHIICYMCGHEWVE